ncbi:MAG: ATP-binding cassette domain-containing protein [Crocinitomicaceae bacterium]|nr:ATP-binding cassette domain-containing protein [Crocinitomicaceae bacterium]
MGNIIELKDVQIYQQSELVLNNINFVVNDNDLVYLIGKTGSGKSSLLKTLYGELFLKHGKGSVSGVDLRTLGRKDIPMLRRKIGIVFQDFQLLTDRSVLRNLIFVMEATGWTDKNLMKNRAESVLKMVGIDHKANQMPHTLSGGEQQRISIARALLNNPPLILADEPTGNLDPETSEEIMRLLIAVAKEEKSAVVMATHDMSVVEKFPGRVFRVENGNMKEVDNLNQFDPFKTLFND